MRLLETKGRKYSKAKKQKVFNNFSKKVECRAWNSSSVWYTVMGRVGVLFMFYKKKPSFFTKRSEQV